METRIFNLAALVSLVFAFYLATLTMAQAQTPSTPAKDYFPDKWDEYSSKAGKFRVRFPKQPQESVSTEGLEVHSLEYAGLVNYRVSSIDTKTSIDDPQKAKVLLQELKTSALKSLKDADFRIVAEREVTVDGHKGMFVHFEVQRSLVLRMQWVVAGSRVYTITVASGEPSPGELEGKTDSDKLAVEFINSFHIIP